MINLKCSIRRFKNEKIRFLWEMLYQSIYVQEGEEAPSRAILKEPAIEKYMENWGATNDHAFIALDEENHPIGAIWIRMFTSEQAGYGFIDEHTPELGMAIVSEYRGQGIGKRLLSQMIEFARMENYPAVSLSVDPRNKPALHLYEKYGFEKLYQDDGGSWTMKINLKGVIHDEKQTDSYK